MPWKRTDQALTMVAPKEKQREPQRGRQPPPLNISGSSLTIDLLEDRRKELLEQLRPLAPELVHKLELTLGALREQLPARGEYDGLDRSGAIRQFLQKVGRPAELGEIRDAVGSPASRFPGRSIWAGGKREVEQGRLLNVADEDRGEAWVLALPEWREKT